MRALVILLSLAWFAISGWAGQRSLKLKRHRLLGLGALISALLAPLVCLLVISGTVDYYGGSFHEGSIWLRASIILVTANLALGYACLAYLPERPTASMKLMQFCGTACVILVALVVAVTGVRDGFPAAAWLHWSAVAGLAVSALAGIGLAAALLRRKGQVKSRG